MRPRDCTGTSTDGAPWARTCDRRGIARRAWEKMGIKCSVSCGFRVTFSLAGLRESLTRCRSRPGRILQATPTKIRVLPYYERRAHTFLGTLRMSRISVRILLKLQPDDGMKSGTFGFLLDVSSLTATEQETSATSPKLSLSINTSTSSLGLAQMTPRESPGSQRTSVPSRSTVS